MIEYIPMCCVDIVVLHQGRVLLVKRDREPAKNEWWFPGGRILKNERLEKAVKRKAKEEVGLDVEVVRKIGAYETLFKESAIRAKTGTHTVNIVYVVKPKNPLVRLDKDHTAWKWISSAKKENAYIRTVLKDAAVFR